MLYLACVLNARFLALSPLHSFVDRAVPFALSARLSLFRLLLSSLLAQYRVSRLAERVSWKKKSGTREWRWMKRGIYVNFEYRTAARFEYKLGATLVDCRGNRAEPELRALSPFFLSLMFFVPLRVFFILAFGSVSLLRDDCIVSNKGGRAEWIPSIRRFFKIQEYSLDIISFEWFIHDLSSVV